MKKHIPNTITCCNLISGCIATYCAMYGMPLWALMWIIIGAVFDFFDGMSARLLHVSSPIGKELDSLADCVTFGVAPSAMLFHELIVIDYPSIVTPLADYLPFAAFIMAGFSALRLAKFNLDERQSMGFIGLPTPANALFWGSMLAGFPELFEHNSYSFAILLVLMLVSCWILISEIPMFALKFKNWSFSYGNNPVKYGFIIFSALVLILAGLSGIAAIIVAYVLVSIVLNVMGKNA